MREDKKKHHKFNPENSDEDFEVSLDKYLDMCITHSLSIAYEGIKTGIDAKNSLLSLSISVNQLESICRASDIINQEDYEKEVQNRMQEIKDEDIIIRKAKIDNLKLEILLRKILKKSGVKFHKFIIG